MDKHRIKQPQHQRKHFLWRPSPVVPKNKVAPYSPGDYRDRKKKKPKIKGDFTCPV
jgi:hypothetical protein